jgi:hypothetical protein
MLAAIDTAQVFRFLSIAMVISLVAIAKFFNTARKPSPQTDFLSDEQRSFSGVWFGNMGAEQTFLEVRSLGEIVSGSMVKGSRVYALRNGTLVPPVVRFDLIESDGTGFLFSGRITNDGISIRGHWSPIALPESDSHSAKRFSWDMTRLRIAPKCEELRGPSTTFSTNSIEPGLSSTQSVLAPYLVYCALSGLVNAYPGLIASNSEKMDPAAEEPVLNEPALGVIPSAEKSVNHQTCPKCQSDWNEAFAFCLLCGYT